MLKSGGTQDMSRDEFLRLMAASAPVPDCVTNNSDGDDASDVARLEVSAAPLDPANLGLEIFDTPGFNSVVAQHETTLRAFLPLSDVIVFVAGYRTGFGQSDQDLFEIAREATSADTPTLLAINRVPVGVTIADPRVIEILRNVTDSLGRSPDVVLIRSAPDLPDTAPLWTAVRRLAGDPARAAEIQRKLDRFVRALATEELVALQRRLDILSASQDELDAVREGVEALKTAKTESDAAVRRTMERISSQIPRVVDSLQAGMAARIGADIDSSGKWLGPDECAGWVAHHALPYEARQSARRLEELIFVELDQLNRELAEIANTAVRRIEERVRVRTATGSKIALSLAKTLAERVGGAAALQALRGIGGVGGAAAGAGNLVKMVVKRLGAVFGKTFGREVYRAIGKIFNKRVLAALGGGAQLLIEVGLYLREVKTWQRDLKARAVEALATWAKEIKADVLDSQLPALQENNLAGIHDVYEDLIVEATSAILARADPEAERSAIEKGRAALQEVFTLLPPENVP